MEQYQRLEMEVIAFDTEDVITTSSGKDIETEETPKVSIIARLPG